MRFTTNDGVPLSQFSRQIAFYIFSALIVFATVEAPAGAVLRMHYSNIRGDTIADLKKDASFPDQPDAAVPLTEVLEIANTGKDNYGELIRGYIEAPQTG